MPPAEVQPVRFGDLVRVIKLADESLDLVLLVEAADRLERHQRDGFGGFHALEIIHAVLLHFPADEIRFNSTPAQK